MSEQEEEEDDETDDDTNDDTDIQGKVKVAHHLAYNTDVSDRVKILMSNMWDWLASIHTLTLWMLLWFNIGVVLCKNTVIKQFWISLLFLSTIINKSVSNLTVYNLNLIVLLISWALEYSKEDVGTSISTKEEKKK